MRRSVTLLPALFLALFVRAQSPVLYELRSTPVLDDRGIKYLHAIVKQLDPQGRATHFEERIKILLNSTVAISDLVSTLQAATGATFFVVNGAPSSERMLEPRVPDGFPPIPVNPAQEADHAAAKQAWREANPELHRAYLDQLRSRTPSHE